MPTRSTTRTPEPNFVITAEGELHGIDTPENRELARRVRACVNACEGISTIDLEGGIVRQMLAIVQNVGPLLEREPAPLRKSA